MRASFLPVETHCEDGGWIQPGLNLFSFSDAIKPLVNRGVAPDVTRVLRRCVCCYKYTPRGLLGTR